MHKSFNFYKILLNSFSLERTFVHDSKELQIQALTSDSSSLIKLSKVSIKKDLNSLLFNKGIKPNKEGKFYTTDKLVLQLSSSDNFSIES